MDRSIPCIPSTAFLIAILKNGKNKIRNIKKEFTREERIRHAAIRRQIEQEKAELITRGRKASSCEHKDLARSHREL